MTSHSCNSFQATYDHRSDSFLAQLAVRRRSDSSIGVKAWVFCLVGAELAVRLPEPTTDDNGPGRAGASVLAEAMSRTPIAFAVGGKSTFVFPTALADTARG